jgi:hypothetical protein
MWKVEQILANAKYEKKCDYSIYAIYIDYLKNSTELKGISEVE